jgi:excinuclease UvrABC nuclease subunit
MEEIEKLFENSIKLEANCPGIYFLFHNEDLVYIGKGWNCLLRIAEHTRKDSVKKFTSWNYIRIDEIEEYNRIEKELIKKYKPIYNKTFIK